MNQIETWFGILTSGAIRRGSFGSVKELIAMIDAFTRQWNEGASPFTWVKTPNQSTRQGGPQAASEQRIGTLIYVLVTGSMMASDPTGRPARCYAADDRRP